MSGETAQWIAVAIIVAIAVVAMVRRLRRKDSGNGCCGCPQNDCCKRKNDANTDCTQK